MKQSEIKELSLEDLRERLELSKDNYSKMKLNHSVSALENPQEIKVLRKSIARIATEIRKREIEKVNEAK
mgnify:CR=1 FL=1